MASETAELIINFIFDHAPAGERIEIGLFGGEPLLYFDKVQSITEIIERHPSFDSRKVELSLVTNGTLCSDQILAFLGEHDIALCVSCDGPPQIQDQSRHFADNRRSSHLVEKTIIRGLEALPLVLVNAVYHPGTLKCLPEIVQYLTGLGVKDIYLSPDFSAHWTKEDAELLPALYGAIANVYVQQYISGEPCFINLIEGKIAAILNHGYRAEERCMMGRMEFAFSPDGGIYPCERLVGPSGDMKAHRIGHVESGIISLSKCHKTNAAATPESPCKTCGVRDYCMNWCGCSNFFSSGSYDRVGPFLCASERAMIEAALYAFETLSKHFGAGTLARLLGQPCRQAA